MQYLKSPLNYVGGKYRLLSQIMPYFPDKIDTFVDLFSGGGTSALTSRLTASSLTISIHELMIYSDICSITTPMQA